jgi:Protein of unknown function (DUF3037)
MGEQLQLEFFLLRYVPHAVRQEFVNIGVLMVEAGANGSVLADVRFAKDWQRVQRLDPQADVEVIEALLREIRAEVGEIKDRAMLLRRMEDSFSNVIQLSAPMQVVTATPAAEIETLASIFVDEAKVSPARAPTGRGRILEAMRDAFEQAGVAKFLSSVPVAPYTKPGDPFKFDFGYRVGNEIKLFHAVSLKANVDAAVLLAARYPKIASAMELMTAATPRLTAVVDDGLDRTQEVMQFALSAMEEEKIRIVGVGEISRIAEVARTELRA